VKEPKQWRPIPPSEKDLFSQVGATKVLLAYIDTLERMVVDLKSMHLADREQIRRILRDQQAMQLELDHITGKRISMLTDNEARLIEIETRQQAKTADRVRRRQQQRTAAKARTREADRIARNRQRPNR
jgi:hypothetical protein